MSHVFGRWHSPTGLWAVLYIMSACTLPWWDETGRSRQHLPRLSRVMMPFACPLQRVSAASPTCAFPGGDTGSLRKIRMPRVGLLSLLGANSSLLVQSFLLTRGGAFSCMLSFPPPGGRSFSRTLPSWQGGRGLLNSFRLKERALSDVRQHLVERRCDVTQSLPGGGASTSSLIERTTSRHWDPPSLATTTTLTERLAVKVGSC
jgi:hypothetical protein